MAWFELFSIFWETFKIIFGRFNNCVRWTISFQPLFLLKLVFHPKTHLNFISLIRMYTNTDDSYFKILGQSWRRKFDSITCVNKSFLFFILQRRDIQTQTDWQGENLIRKRDFFSIVPGWVSRSCLWYPHYFYQFKMSPKLFSASNNFFYDKKTVWPLFLRMG